MKLVILQVIDTDEKLSDSLVIQLPDRPSIKLLTLEVMTKEFEELVKSFVKTVDSVYETEGDCNE